MEYKFIFDLLNDKQIFNDIFKLKLENSYLCLNNIIIRNFNNNSKFIFKYINVIFLDINSIETNFYSSKIVIINKTIFDQILFDSLTISVLIAICKHPYLEFPKLYLFKVIKSYDNVNIKLSYYLKTFIKYCDITLLNEREKNGKYFYSYISDKNERHAIKELVKERNENLRNSIYSK